MKLSGSPAKSAHPPARLWYLRGAAGTLKSGSWILRAVDNDWAANVSLRLYRGHRLRAGEWPDSAPVFRYTSVIGVPDIAIRVGRSFTIVSDRFREFIEVIDPTAAEFFAVQVEGPNRSSLSPNYWAVNWLNVWDCRSDPLDAELDSGKVPPGIGLGVISGPPWYAGDIVVNDATKRLVEKEKFRGLRIEAARVKSSSKSKARRQVAERKGEVATRELDPLDACFNVRAFLRRFPKGAGYKPHFPHSSALLDYVIMHRADVRVLRCFLEAGLSPNVGGDAPEGAPPLAVVLRPKSPKILELLEEFGVDWNVSNSLGITPLMAATSEPVSAFVLLLKLGADPLARSLGGWTVLHHLLDTTVMDDKQARRLMQAVTALVRGGAELNARSDDGQSPLDIFMLHCSGRPCEDLVRRHLTRLGASLAAGNPDLGPRFDKITICRITPT